MSWSRGHGPGESRNYQKRGSSGTNRLSEAELDTLRKLVPHSTFAAFAFETPGLDATTERIVEIGAVKFTMAQDEDGWAVAASESYQSLVHPGRPIPYEVTNIHGISDLDVVNAPSFKKAAPDFLAFIQGAILVAHNAPFDTGFLLAETQRAEIPAPKNMIFDTIAIAKTAISGLPSYSLVNLAKSFAIKQTAAHRGDDDARVCMEIFGRCCRLLFRQ